MIIPTLTTRENASQLADAFGGRDAGLEGKSGVLCVMQAEKSDFSSAFFIAYFHDEAQRDNAANLAKEILNVRDESDIGANAFTRHGGLKSGQVNSDLGTPLQVFTLTINAGTDTILQNSEDPLFFRQLKEITLDAECKAAIYVCAHMIKGSEGLNEFQQQNLKSFIQAAPTTPQPSALPLTELPAKILEANTELREKGETFHTGAFVVFLDEYIRLQAAYEGNSVTGFTAKETKSLIQAIKFTAPMTDYMISYRDDGISEGFSSRTFNATVGYSNNQQAEEIINQAVKTDMLEALEAYAELNEKQPKSQQLAIGNFKAALVKAITAGGLEHNQTKLAKRFHPHLLNQSQEVVRQYNRNLRKSDNGLGCSF